MANSLLRPDNFFLHAELLILVVMRKQMPRKNLGGVCGRAWNLLRVSLFWAMKAGVLPKMLRSLGHQSGRDDEKWYKEREFSFDDSPVFNFKLTRPMGCLRLPCINPTFSFDMDCDTEEVPRPNAPATCKEEVDDEISGGGSNREIVCCEEESVDVRAEEFIAKFHEQMKLEELHHQVKLLQISELPYEETLDRGIRQ